jgi:ankyrin repeat protein
VAPNIGDLVRAGDLDGLRALLQRSPELVHSYSRSTGHTPLMVAAESPRAPLEMIEFLIAAGAKLHEQSRHPYEFNRSVLSLAIRAGDPTKVALLIDKGANVHYTYSAGYDALLDAACGTDTETNPLLVDLVKLLIAHGVKLNTKSTYDEAALSVLSCSGRFDAAQALLDAGADASRLEWTALHRAVALGSLDQVRHALDTGIDIEARDRRSRTSFLLAIQTGDVDKAELLIQRGAKSRVRGHCGAPPLFFAIENYHAPMLGWLLRIGADIEQTNQFGETPLMRAAERKNAAAVRTLLAAGANREADKCGETALARATSRDTIIQVLDAGADPRQLYHERQRILIGLGEVSVDRLLDISKPEFLAGRSPRFGTANPERIVEPFWLAMIRAGVNAFQGAQDFFPTNDVRPVWCAQRFGQSLTRLPDGRVLQIGGEHEDYYDEDFCIYNDVFVHHPSGAIEIYGYPEEVFPPTDFHSATLVGKHVYVIGSLGYQGTRRFGHTPVYRLDADTLRLERLHPTGEAPGWISRHRAVHISSNEIHIAGGNIAVDHGGAESHLANDRIFVLDTAKLAWRRE